MSENEHLINADVADVFAVLTDGWSYGAWVVGASRVRDVDAHWPEPGGKIRHSVDAWPVLINDTTSVLEYDPLSRLRLRVRGWPAPAASSTSTWPGLQARVLRSVTAHRP